MEENRLVFVALQVSDLKASHHFYRDLVGVPLEPGQPDKPGDPWIGSQHFEYSWTEGAYTHFALFPRPKERTTNAQVGFLIRDLKAVHTRMAKNGIKVVHPPRVEPWGLTARYRDPDGNIVGLTQIPKGRFSHDKDYSRSRKEK